MMQRFAGGDSNVVCDIVKSDESWIYCYNLLLSSLGFELLLALKHHTRRLFISGLQNSRVVVSISVTDFVMVSRPPPWTIKTTVLCAVRPKQIGM
ncbi:hypothetical protein EVAR_95873_1 [Eumeta japonica]|uniref:Uncharacterized protein n=1 Tax=Eumeta variegata TaxID=151549 RepID=A0A4C1VLH8_EUMVA|nr:hypothetical protein EVAR_95873_1 [Eumeta japonica]